MKTSSQKTFLTVETLEIRVFEAVCLNERPELPVFHLSFETLFPKADGFIARILVPIQAITYAPRPPSAYGSFLTNPKPMSL